MVKPLSTSLQGWQHHVEVKKQKTENWKKLNKQNRTELKKEKTECQMKNETEIDGEEEVAPPDWRVRAGHRNKQTQKEREDQTRRPTISMDHHFMKVKLKEDRHQNIMRSVALKMAIEKMLTSERVANFIGLRGYREITLKSNTELAIIAFRNHVAENVQSRSRHRGRSDRRQGIDRAHRERSDADTYSATHHLFYRDW